MEDSMHFELTLAQTKATSWFDALPPMQKEALLRDAGRSYFTFNELVDQYIKWLEERVIYYQKVIDRRD